jgi:hypothetical protein
MQLFLKDCICGIFFGDDHHVKLKTSHRDLLLILGILVAAIISITTWLYDPEPQASQIAPPLSPKVNSSQLVKNLGKAVLKLGLKVR